MDNIVQLKNGKYTVERFMEERKISRQSAINLLSKLKHEGFVRVEGGGRQIRIYTISEIQIQSTNGFYDLVNRYSPEKLQAQFAHIVHGNYTIEHAIIDGLKIGDARTREATMHLFLHVRSWKRLFELARKEKLQTAVITLYKAAREKIKVKRMPRKYI